MYGRAGGSEGRSAVQVLLKLIQASGGTCCPACQVVTSGTACLPISCLHSQPPASAKAEAQHPVTLHVVLSQQVAISNAHGPVHVDLAQHVAKCVLRAQESSSAFQAKMAISKMTSNRLLMAKGRCWVSRRRARKQHSSCAGQSLPCAMTCMLLRCGL